jgi:hypothetical protein
MSDAPAPIAVKPGKMFRPDGAGVTFRQRFTPHAAHLRFLSAGEFLAPPGTRSQDFCLPVHESLMFQWQGKATVAVEGELFPLAPYDVWRIAGERFWVGDKNRDIMTGTAQAITTSLVQSPKSKVQGHSLDLGPWTFHGTSFHPDQRNRP